MGFRLIFQGMIDPLDSWGVQIHSLDSGESQGSTDDVRPIGKWIHSPVVSDQARTHRKHLCVCAGVFDDDHDDDDYYYCYQYWWLVIIIDDDEYLLDVVRLFHFHQMGPACGLWRGPPCYQHAWSPNVAHEKYSYDDSSSISCTLSALQIFTHRILPSWSGNWEVGFSSTSDWHKNII